MNNGLETLSFIQRIADFTGLPTLVIETGFLLILTFIILIIILVWLANFRIKKEMIKLNRSAEYIAALLTKGYKNFVKDKIAQGYYEFKPEEWKDDTREKVLYMLQDGKSYNEIVEKLDVTKSYISEIELWAKKEGFLIR